MLPELGALRPTWAASYGKAPPTLRADELDHGRRRRGIVHVHDGKRMDRGRLPLIGEVTPYGVIILTCQSQAVTKENEKVGRAVWWVAQLGVPVATTRGD